MMITEVTYKRGTFGTQIWVFKVKYTFNVKLKLLMFNVNVVENVHI